MRLGTLISKSPSMPLHPPDLSLPNVLFQPTIQVFPPLKQHRIANQLEPRSKLVLWIIKHLAEVVGGGIASRLDLVQIGLKVDVGLDEQNVVDCFRD